MALVLDGTNKITATELADDAVTAAKIASGAITSAALPAGSVLQVVQAQSTSAGTISSTSYAEYMSTSITPSSTSSKILVMFSAPLGYEDSRGSGSVSFYYNQTIYRGTTNIGEGSGLTGTYQHSLSYNDYGINNGGMTILDSPATDSAVTYKVMHKMGTAGSVTMCLEGRANLILMEIAG